VTPYQAFAFFWHLRRGDCRAALMIAAAPAAWFRALDMAVLGAYKAGRNGA